MTDAPGPDVLVVIADQWRGQEQGWLGEADVETPHLDALAAAGAAVECAVANHPVCTPSRGDLLTGLHPWVHGAVVNDLPLADAVPTWATVLRARGYATTWIGKWHLDGVPRDAAVAAGRGGFDTFASTSCSHDYLDGHYYLSRPGRTPERVAFVGYEPHEQTRLAVAALSEDHGRPRCVVVSYGPPHNPYDAVPATYRDRYAPAAQTPRDNVRAADEATAREQLALYRAAITAIDEQIGVLVETLRASGRLADTLVLVTSDHGDLLGSHGARAKQSPYAESVRVPMVWHRPGQLAPRRIRREDGIVSMVDVAPTLLDLVGAPPLPRTHGRSVAGALRGDGDLPGAALIANLVSVDEGWRQGVGEWRGFVDATRTYARRVDDDRTPWLLVDDVHDPGQADNRVNDAAEVRAADDLLDGLLEQVDDRQWTGERVLRETDGGVAAWNRRELAMHGAAGRVLEPSSGGTA